MIKRNVLIGNGVNIAFSENDDYKNYKIIERLMSNLENNKYEPIFQNTIDSNELASILIGLNDVFKTKIDCITTLQWTDNEDELMTLLEIAKRYKGKSKEILDIGMEDYFFVLKLFNNSLGSNKADINDVFLGLKWLFLDSIYNDGKIENLYLKMNNYSKELLNYDNIFTLNYDTNIDKLVSEKSVYHLHGSFGILNDTYNPETILGRINQEKDNPATIINGFEHLFCNAVMGYSGSYKLDFIQTPAKGNIGIESMVSKLSNPINNEALAIYQQWKNSSNHSEIIHAKSIDVKIQNPQLKYTEYPINTFKSISGVLDIIGLSPNNDSHIFDMINKNPNIKKINYFGTNPADIAIIKDVISKPVEYRNVLKYWDKIKNN